MFSLHKDKELINNKKKIISYLTFLLFITIIIFNSILFKETFAINTCKKIASDHFKTRESITNEFSKCINSFPFIDKNKKEDIVNHLYFPNWENVKKVQLLKY